MNQDTLHPLPKGYRLEEYEIDSVLGHGGFGITYLAHDFKLGLKYAIKEYMPSDLAMRTEDDTVCPRSRALVHDFEWGCERFVEEARVLALFKHPNIVEVRRYFAANGTAYIVMPYEEGESLGRLLKRQGKLSPERLRSIVVPLVNALDSIHKENIMHRDIKPDNIFLRRDGVPILLDFGAARQALSGKTRTLTRLVSPGYAPIEQYHGDGSPGPWSDIYALACVMYRAVSGKMPPEAPARIESDDMVHLSDIAGTEWPRPLLKAIEHGMSPLKRDRPESACDWLVELYGEKAHDPKAVKIEPMPFPETPELDDDDRVDTMSAGTPEGGGTMISDGDGTHVSPKADQLVEQSHRADRLRQIRGKLGWALGGFGAAIAIAAALRATGF